MPEKPPATIGPYSPSVRAGGFLFVSGQIPLDPATGRLVPGDVSAQAERALTNLAAVMAAAGASLAHVVRTTIYLADLGHFSAVNETYGRYFAPPYPARVTVQVAALPLGALVEIDAIAFVPD